MVLYRFSIAAVYAFTIFVGVLGNTWVAISVVRSRRPRSTMGLSPSDRLRSYIGLLALVDLLVIASLFTRFVHLLIPDIQIEPLNCKIVYIVDQLVKLSSLTCLTCISFERYLTIAKPFKNTIRKKFIRYTPLVAISLVVGMLVAVVVIAIAIQTTSDNKDCTLPESENSVGVKIARWTICVMFITLLIALCFNYGQIARHLRKKFWQRKSRICTNPRLTKQPLVQQPKYMKDTTTVILRIATFHFVCWLPYCVIQSLPDTFIPGFGASFTIRLYPLSNLSCSAVEWTAFIAGWFAYINSALNWIFYAVLNRDLRTIIRETTERRKRSTMSQQSPSSAIHRSLRRQISQTLRFFYSINSYRSACNSFDDSFASFQPGNTAKLSAASCYGGSTGHLNRGGESGNATTPPALRSNGGRAHTFSNSPRTSLLSQDSASSVATSRYVAIAAIAKLNSDAVEKFV